MASPRDPAWGSLGESGQSLDSMFQFFSSVVFARASTAILKASGYQVLDAAGNGALKKVCDNKPGAASVGLAKNKAAFVSSGPTSKMSPPGSQSMGFSAFNSMSGGSKSLSVYFPFTSGVKPSAKTAIRTSLAQSPLYKLPSRMILSFNAVDEVDARLEWVGDAETARQHKTVTWVVRDRYLSLKANLADPNVAATALPLLLVNALKLRLSVPFEGAGSLWWRGMPDAITAFAPGLSYTLLTPSLPIFSASATKWNERGHGSASDIEPPAATSGVRADYMMVLPKFDNEPNAYLCGLPNGIDDLSSYGPMAALGFAYTLAVPKEISVVRTTQISDSIWVSGKCNIKSPMPIAPNSSKGSLGWRVSKEAVSLSVVAAANLDHSGALSASVGLSQDLDITGISNVPAKGVSALGLAPAGSLTPSASMSYKFSGGGGLQVAAEGTSAVGALIEMPVPSNKGVTLQAGCRVGARENLSYGVGMTAEM